MGERPPSKICSNPKAASVKQIISVQEIGSKNDWMMPITSYLKNSVLPDGKDAARRLKVQATLFVLIKDVLYKRGLLTPVPKVSYPQ